jgi:hypothetical protein
MESWAVGQVFNLQADLQSAGAGWETGAQLEKLPHKGTSPVRRF